jgi:hypothetical protein
MTDSLCSYPGDRDEALVTYLYDDLGDAVARVTFEAHLATCVRCADELAALRGVRTQLGRWHPPSFGSGADRGSHDGARRWWREIPAWAQVAAALLFLGVSSAIANLDVRYDANGLSVRTGWMSSARAGQPTVAPAPVQVAPTGTASQLTGAPWRTDLVALEQQLKSEFHGAQGAAPAGAAASHSTVDAETLRRVRALIDESEKRQQRELALRLAEAIRDVNAQRQADLIKVDRVLGTVQNNLGIQVLKNRAQMQQMDYFIRTSQRQ